MGISLGIHCVLITLQKRGDKNLYPLQLVNHKFILIWVMLEATHIWLKSFYLFCTIINCIQWIHDISVCIVTKLFVGQSGNQYSIRSKGKSSFSSQQHPDWLCGTPSLPPKQNQGDFTGGNAAQGMKLITLQMKLRIPRAISSLPHMSLWCDA